MAKIYIDEKGRTMDSDKASFADKIMDLRQKGDQWVVIDELIKYWLATDPDEVQAVKIDIEDQREMLTDKEFGTTKLGGAMERRFKLLFPTKIMLLIRSVYKEDELKMDKDFYDEFATRYPGFRVAEK